MLIFSGFFNFWTNQLDDKIQPICSCQVALNMNSLVF